MNLTFAPSPTTQQSESDYEHLISINLTENPTQTPQKIRIKQQTGKYLARIQLPQTLPNAHP